MLAVNGDLFVPDFLERLARAQSEEGLRLPPRFFALWREAMLKTVRACDPLCDEEILTAWAMAIALGSVSAPPSGLTIKLLASNHACR